MTNQNSQFRPATPQKTIPDLTYTVQKADSGYDLDFTNASAVTVTVPSDASSGIGEGFNCNINQMGAGAVTVAAADGVTVNVAETLVLAKQYASATLTHKAAANTWLLTGYLTAA